MKIQQTLDVPSAYFYTKIMESVLYDIKKNTNQVPSAEMLTGFEYQKEVQKNRMVRIKIVKAIKNREYAYETSLPGQVFEASYEIQETQDGKTQVTYHEESKFTDTLRDWNQRLMTLLLGHSRKKRFYTMMKQIEQSYAEI